MSNNIKENSFDPAPGGMGGSMGGNLLGTPTFPGSTRSPSSYNTDHYNKHYDTDRTGQPDTQMVDDPKGSFDKALDKLFKGKEKPTIDDITCGIQHELQRMIHKDKRVAKRLVIGNMLKFGAKYYTGLHNMNIDDKDMDTNPVMQERLNVLNQMVADKQSKRQDLKLNDAIQDILKEKRERISAKSDFFLKNMS
jgi:hypothetical protein